jgi:hypothetical protein
MARTTSTKAQTNQSNDMTEILQECVRVCQETLAYCLEQGGDHVAQEHFQAMMDCADACEFSLRLVHRGSDLREDAMELCAEASEACAESCEEFEGDERMEACAETCRECAEMCRGG